MVKHADLSGVAEHGWSEIVVEASLEGATIAPASLPCARART
jgi:hypothetical protein